MASGGLPRARGDRPRIGPWAMMSIGAPPRPRGSTRFWPGQADAQRGSPAPAGIDLSRTPISRAPIWLPRARGDRPFHRIGRPDEPPAPPRPRGSTPPPMLLSRPSLGSPAPAGIDPRAGWPRPRRPRLPRARGDRPDPDFGRTDGGTAPPRPRGSTPCEDGHVIYLRGSPAPAGIDPIPGAASNLTPWLPRARGDRPAIGADAPREASAPPRPRGSTPPATAAHHALLGSPAPAGIDPRP